MSDDVGDLACWVDFYLAVLLSLFLARIQCLAVCCSLPFKRSSSSTLQPPHPRNSQRVALSRVQESCPEACSGHGVCASGVCSCFGAYAGPTCSEASAGEAGLLAFDEGERFEIDTNSWNYHAVEVGTIFEFSVDIALEGADINWAYIGTWCRMFNCTRARRARACACVCVQVWGLVGMVKGWVRVGEANGPPPSPVRWPYHRTLLWRGNGTVGYEVPPDWGTYDQRAFSNGNNIQIGMRNTRDGTVRLFNFVNLLLLWCTACVFVSSVMTKPDRRFLFFFKHTFFF